MIGFSVMMGYAALILFAVAFLLRKGNTDMLHGKVFRRAQHPEELAKALSKPVMLVGAAILLSGIAAPMTGAAQVLLFLVDFLIALVAVIWWIRIVCIRF